MCVYASGWHENMWPPMVNTHTSYGNTHNLLWNHVVVVEPYPNGTYRRYCREDVWDSDDRRITLCDDCNDDCNGSVDALIGTWAHATREGIRERGGRVHVGICVRKIDEGMTKTAPLMHPCCTLVIRTVSRRQKESNTYHSLTHILSIYMYIVPVSQRQTNVLFRILLPCSCDTITRHISLVGTAVHDDPA